MSVQARKVILRSRFYRLFAILFAVVGCVVFLALFMGERGGFDLFRSMEPVLLILVPFLPAAFLSWHAGRLEKKYFRLIEKAK
ncbi:MAG TPA: hypothetical protein PKX87_07105 [Alphaproteobacteria bacterium]|nr:hypothetical protein [Alphaproteobacteria bacterium]